MKKIGFFVTHMLQEGGTKMNRLLTYMKKRHGSMECYDFRVLFFRIRIFLRQLKRKSKAVRMEDNRSYGFHSFLCGEYSQNI